MERKEQDRYALLQKRRSFHKFNAIEPLTEDAKTCIARFLDEEERLDGEAPLTVCLEPARNTTKQMGEEYCVLFYGKGPESCRNAGYLGEKLDLWCAGEGIGSLWAGFGKPTKPDPEGCDYIIMLRLGRVPGAKLRENFKGAVRKPVSDFWKGPYADVLGDARFAPSACNWQPWRVEATGTEITVYRRRPFLRFLKRTPVDRMNGVDMGIFLCALEACLDHAGMKYERELFPDDLTGGEKKNAVYHLIKE